MKLINRHCANAMCRAKIMGKVYTCSYIENMCARVAQVGCLHSKNNKLLQNCKDQ